MAKLVKNKKKKVSLVLSCEHAGAKIPRDLRYLFSDNKNILKTHQAYDIGAMAIAKDLARLTHAPLHCGTMSRLVVDLNRSQKNKGLFSLFTHQIDQPQRQIIIDKFYLPYRSSVEKNVANSIARRRVVAHISVHSFTPVLKEKERVTDLSVLYDPARTHERVFAATWVRELKKQFPSLRIHRNTPYRGISDGFTRDLRMVHRSNQYVGLELEMNQKIVGSFPSASERRQFSLRIHRALEKALLQFI